MRQLDARHSAPILDHEEPIIDQMPQPRLRIGHSPAQGGEGGIEGDIFPETGIGDELVLKKLAQSDRMRPHLVLVKCPEDARGLAGAEIIYPDALARHGGRETALVETLAEQTEDRRHRIDLVERHLRIGPGGGANDSLGHVSGNDGRLAGPLRAGFIHRTIGLGAGEQAQLDAVLHHRGHGAPPALEAGEEVVAQGHRDPHGPGLEVVTAQQGAFLFSGTGLELAAQGRGRTVLDEVGELGEEIAGGLAGAGITCGVARGPVLALDEDFLKLIEDQHGRGREIRLVAVAAVVRLRKPGACSVVVKFPEGSMLVEYGVLDGTDSVPELRIARLAPLVPTADVPGKGPGH